MRRILLIVDDCPEIGRGLRRCLKHAFTDVCVANCPDEAEAFLVNDENKPTHLLCDYYLGEDFPTGLELVRRWRERFPNLQAAAVFSGSELTELPAQAGVDRVFRKPLDIDALEEFFTRDAQLEEGAIT